MQTSRLELTRLTKEHAPGYFAIWSDPFTTRWSSHGPCKTLDDATEWMSSLLLDNNPQGENYAVFLRPDLSPDTVSELQQLQRQRAATTDKNPTTDPTTDNDDNVLAPGRLLGWIGTWKSDPVPELGFIFHRDTWGLGFATEALHGFVELFWRVKPEFDLLEGYCDTENEGSIRVLRKGGFELVETTYKDYVLPWMTPAERDTMRFRAVRPGRSLEGL